MWNTIIAATIIWVAIMAPLDAGFTVGSKVVFYIDLFVTGIFMADIIFSFFTGYALGAHSKKNLRRITVTLSLYTAREFQHLQPALGSAVASSS